ncbi:MAG: hypothetical protein JW908_00695 [Anaerolineales bacterium]|nr:hypothetical protein [Anaerolineales bacterium]
MTHIGYHYTLQWGNPYTDPPEGKPRVIAEMFETIKQRKNRVANGDEYFPRQLSALHTLGDGYGCHISAVSTPHKKLPKDTLAEVRKKRIKRRMQKKYPMLADILVAEEMEKKPEYYAGETDPDIQAMQDEAIWKEEEIYQRFLSETGGKE